LSAVNLHATALLLEDRGVLITGGSGSGKTMLGFALIDHHCRQGGFARWVADDQVLLSACAGRLICAAPPAIAGLAEVRGVGPRPIDHEPQMVADLLVRLVPRAQAPRYQEQRHEVLAGCPIPSLDLPAADSAASALAVTAWIKAASFP
jgi:serine kinase of HPr protein (carbohydrate metabolism regulator)